MQDCFLLDTLPADQRTVNLARANNIPTAWQTNIWFGKDGELARGRMLQIQFHDVKGNDIEQFRTMGTQTVLTPAEYSSGTVIYPYEKAK